MRRAVLPAAGVTGVTDVSIPRVPTSLADDHGRVFALAIDHVASLDAVLAGGDATAFKRLVIDTLGPLATTVLVDAPHAGLVPSSTPRMLGLDDDDPPEQVAEMVALGAQVVKAHALVAAGARPRVAASIDRRVEAWGHACRAAGVPFLFEPLTDATGDRRAEVAALAAHFAHDRFAIDVLKIQLPIEGPASERAHRDAHARLADACGTVPHVFLSGGPDGPAQFIELLQQAVDVGSTARGAVVGRALWCDAAAAPEADRAALLADRGVTRFRALIDVVSGFPSAHRP